MLQEEDAETHQDGARSIANAQAGIILAALMCPEQGGTGGGGTALAGASGRGPVGGRAWHVPGSSRVVAQKPFCTCTQLVGLPLVVGIRLLRESKQTIRMCQSMKAP